MNTNFGSVLEIVFVVKTAGTISTHSNVNKEQ